MQPDPKTDNQPDTVALPGSRCYASRSVGVYTLSMTAPTSRDECYQLLKHQPSVRVVVSFGEAIGAIDPVHTQPGHALQPSRRRPTATTVSMCSLCRVRTPRRRHIGAQCIRLPRVPRRRPTRKMTCSTPMELSSKEPCPAGAAPDAVQSCILLQSVFPPLSRQEFELRRFYG